MEKFTTYSQIHSKSTLVSPLGGGTDWAEMCQYQDLYWSFEVEQNSPETAFTWKQQYLASSLLPMFKTPSVLGIANAAWCALAWSILYLFCGYPCMIQMLWPCFLHCHSVPLWSLIDLCMVRLVSVTLLPFGLLCLPFHSMCYSLLNYLLCSTVEQFHWHPYSWTWHYHKPYN